MKKRLALVVIVQLALVAIGVAPQLSARVAGDEYRMRVAPVDPIDPFRGAYVTLGYPGLQTPGGSRPPSMGDGKRGAVYAPLVEEDGYWVAADFRRTRPAEGPYLACDDTDWAIRCGIESWFVPQPSDSTRPQPEMSFSSMTTSWTLPRSWMAWMRARLRFSPRMITYDALSMMMLLSAPLLASMVAVPPGAAV